MKFISLSLVAFFLLAGCASTGPGNSQAVYFPSCYAPIHQAAQLDSRLRDAGIGAGKGFLAGTLAGLAGGAISALFTGNAMNIVSGAAIGAAGGTVAGGLYGGMQDNQAQKESLMSMWNIQTDGATQGMGFNQAAATVAMECYTKQANKIEKDLQLNLITEQAATPMLAEIQAGRVEASNLFNQPN